MAIDPYKKELIYRKGNKKQYINGYMQKCMNLFNLIENELQFLELEQSDQILDINRSRERIFSKERIEAENMAIFLDTLKERTSQYVVYIDDDWKYCGALLVSSLGKINSNFLLENNLDDYILFVACDFSETIDLDYYEENSIHYLDITYGKPKS